MHRVHIWAQGTPSAHHRQEPYSKDPALAGMDAAGVERAVIHPPMWDSGLERTRRRIHPHLRRVYDAFGPQRMFWGTDITRKPCSWKQCVTQFTEELPWLAGHDLELVMGRAFCDWIGWKLPGS
jgi:hypothetical protein